MHFFSLTGDTFLAFNLSSVGSEHIWNTRFGCHNAHGIEYVQDSKPILVIMNYYITYGVRWQIIQL